MPEPGGEVGHLGGGEHALGGAWAAAGVKGVSRSPEEAGVGLAGGRRGAELFE